MDIKTLVESRLLAFDPLIDVSEGSIAQITIVNPIVSALEQDPLSTDTREFLLTKFREAFPLMPVAEGDALSDVLISASQLFFEAYRRELEALKRGRSILNIDSMTDDEADALAANWFYSRTLGTNASGTVRVIIDRAQQLIIGPIDNVFSTANNIEFVPTANFAFTASQMLANSLGNNRYYADIPVVAVEPGTAGNIIQGEITTATNVLNLISATNTEPFSGGTDRDTSEQLLTVKLPRAISERTTVTSRGIIAKLSTAIAGVKNYQVIGLDDPEMQRDAISGYSLGEQRAAGVAYVREDIVWLDVAGEIAENDTIILRLEDDPNTTIEVEIGEVLLSANQSSLRNRGNTFIIRAKQLVYSGETVAPFAAGHKKSSARLGHIEIDETTNLGGRADVYLNTSDDVTITSTVQIKTDNIICAGLGISWNAGTTTAVLSHIGGTGDADILEGTYIYYELDGEPRAYEVFKVLQRQLDQTELVFKTGALSSAVNGAVFWRNLSSLEMSLTSPQEKVYPLAGQSPLLVQGNIDAQELRTNLSLSPFGVLPGDRIIVEGALSPMVVQSVVDNIIKIASPLAETIGNVRAEIIRTQNGIPSPITALTEVTVQEQLIPYGRALGLKVEQLAGNRRTLFAGTGFVSPSYAWAVPERAILSRGMTETNTFYERLNEDRDGSDENIPSAILNNVFTVDGIIPNYGTCVIGVRGDLRTSFDQFHQLRLQEIPLYNEMFMAGTRNIYVCLGDVAQLDRLEQLPAKCEEGDILEVRTGQNAGRYIVKDSIQIFVNFNRLAYLGALDGPFFRNLLSVDLAKQRGEDIEIQGIDPAGMDFFVSVTLIRIYGEFPVREHAVIEKYFRTQEIAEAKTISDYDLLLMLSSPESLVDAAALSAGVQQVATGLALDAPMGCAANDISIDSQPLIDALQKTTRSQYAVGNPAVGTGDLVLQQDATSEVYAPRIDNIPLHALFESLDQVAAGNEPLSYKTYDMTTATNGTAQICARPGRYFASLSETADFDDWRTWPRGVPTSRLVPAVSLNALTFFGGVSQSLVTVESYPVLTLEQEAHTQIDPRDAHEIYMHEERFVSGASHITVSTEVFPFFPQLNGAGLTTDELRALDLYNSLASKRNASGDVLSELVDRFELNQQIRWVSPPEDLTDFVENGGGFVFDNTFYTLAAVPLESDRGSSIALAGCSLGSTSLSLVKRNEIDVFSLPSVGDLVTLRMGDTTTTHTISAVAEGGQITLDTPAQFTSASVENFGECFVGKSGAKIYIHGLSGYDLGSDGSISVVTPDTPQATLLGGATAFLTNADIGKRITVWGFYESFSADVAEAIGNEDVADIPSENSYGTSRQSLGSFEISSVSNTYRTEPLLGRDIIHTQTVSLSGFEGAEGADGYISSLPAENVRAFFVVTDGTDDFVTTDAGRVVTEVAEAQFYKPVPEVARIAAVRHDGARFVRVSGLSGAAAPAENSIFKSASSAFRIDGQVYIGYSETKDRNNPYLIGRPGVARALTAQSTLNIQSIGFEQDYSSLADTSLRVEGEHVSGYTLSASDRETSRSSRGELNISVPPSVGGVSSIAQPLSVRALFSSSILQAQALVSSRSDRVVCADLLVRRMAPGYIGADITYVGGPTEETAAESLSELINNSIVTSTPLAKSSIVQRLHRLGALRVHLPLRLYVCIEDMSHRRHVREIKDVLSANMDLQIDATPRIVSLTAAPYDRKLLGAQLSLTRLAATANNLGTGGI